MYLLSVGCLETTESDIHRYSKYIKEAASERGNKDSNHRM